MRRFSTLAVLASTDLAAGFAIQILILASVGIGATTDAYFAGQAPGIVLLAIFQLPIQRAVLSAFGDLPGPRFPALSLYVCITGLLLIAIIMLMLIGKPSLHLLYPNMTSEALSLALTVMGIHGLAVAISAGNIVLLAANHLAGRFVQAEAILSAASLAAVGWVAMMLPQLGVVAAATGQVIKAVLAGSCYAFMLRGQIGWGRPPWKELINIIRPLASAGLLSKLAPLVDRAIAALGASGSMTVLVFAQTVYSAAVGVADRALVAPRLPMLKRDPSHDVVLGLVGRLLLSGVSIVLVSTSAVWLIGNTSWRIEFFPADSLQLLLAILFALAGLPMSTLLAQWLSASLVFIGEARVLARIMTWCFLASLPVKLFAFQYGGILGLAVAMSCYYFSSVLSLWICARRASMRNSASP